MSPLRRRCKDIVWSAQPGDAAFLLALSDRMSGFSQIMSSKKGSSKKREREEKPAKTAKAPEKKKSTGKKQAQGGIADIKRRKDGSLIFDDYPGKDGRVCAGFMFPQLHCRVSSQTPSSSSFGKRRLWRHVLSSNQKRSDRQALQGCGRRIRRSI